MNWKAFWKGVLSTMDDILVWVFTFIGVFLKPFLQDLSKKGPVGVDWQWDRIALSAIVAVVVMLLVDAQPQTEENLKGKKSFHGMKRRLALAFTNGVGWTALIGGGP